MADAYMVGMTKDGLHSDGTGMFGELDLGSLTAAGLECRFVEAHGNHQDYEALADFDAIISFAHAPFDRESARRLPRLKHVARFGAGYDGIDPIGLAEEGVIVTTSPDAVRVPMAQASLTLLLACAHRLVENHECVVSGAWTEGRGRHRGMGLSGKTVGIVGLGSVGSLLATYVQNLGGHVIASGHAGSRSRAARIGVQVVDLMSLATESDFVVVCASLTPETSKLIGPDFLEKMPTHSYLINVSRGGLVDQEALVAALETQGIAGCALDVLASEPPSPDDPLLAMDNVILSPHTLCWTEKFTRDVWTSVVSSVLAVASGDIPSEALERDHLEHTRVGRRTSDGDGKTPRMGLWRHDPDA